MVDIQGGHNNIPYRNDVDIVHPRTKAPTPPNAAGSSYMGYGSYSGADCKVVVHYPYPKELEEMMNKDKTRVQYDLATLDLQIDTMTNTLSTYETNLNVNQIIQLSDRRQALVAELDEINQYIKDVKGFPTSRVLAELQTISYSMFREKSPVRTLGSVYPRAYVRGPRTIGGSMIFTIFNQHVLTDILKLNLRLYNTGTSDHDKFQYTTALADQLPPLDISLIFANEYGSVSHMGLWGVEFVQEGGTFSIEDIFSENVVQYVARDMDPMRLVDKREVDGKGIREEWTETASHLLKKKQKENNPIYRRNQFI